MNSKIKILSIVSLTMLMLSGCVKKDVVPQQVVSRYNIEIPLSEVQMSAENVAVQYVNYIVSGYEDAAYDLVQIPDSVYYTKENMLSAEKEVKALSSNYILYKVRKVGDNVILTYGLKKGEAYTKATKTQASEYIGEIVTQTKEITIPVVDIGNGRYGINVHMEYMTTEQIALKVPDNVDVWFEGVLLDKHSRDDDGCYILTNFIATDYAKIKLQSAIEERDVYLVLNDAAQELNAAENVLLYPNAELYNGVRRWDYKWTAQRETIENAVQNIKILMQNLLTASENQTDFYDKTVQDLFKDSSTAENIKTEYIKLSNAYMDTKTKEFKDLTCVDIRLIDKETMAKKQLTNEITANDILQVYVELEYSYVTYSKTTDITTPHTGTTRGYVYLTRENNEWFIIDIDSSLLKAIR